MWVIFVCWIFTTLSEILRLIEMKRPSKGIAITRKVLMIMYVVHGVAVIALHWVRLIHTGKVCSGDYRYEEPVKDPTKELDDSYYLSSTGYFLWCLIIYYWVTISLLVCFFGLCYALLAGIIVL